MVLGGIRNFSLIALLLLSTQIAFASVEAPISKTEFCDARKNPHYFREMAYNQENLLTFKNGGGLFNKGVCWWHNLFQRSALHLAVYKPELAKPDKVLARKIIHAIAAGKRIVEIPGYKNLSEFSKDWAPEIQSKLEAWQREDGFLKFAWIQGLSGNYHADPKEIAKTFSFVIHQAEQAGQINWTMWQLKGITAHASLMIAGEVEGVNYKTHYIDSNRPTEVKVMTWAPPARSVEVPWGKETAKFVPYVARRSDLAAFKTAADQYCTSRAYDHEFIYEPLSNHVE